MLDAMWTRSRKIGLVAIVGTIVVGVGGTPLYEYFYEYFWGEEYWCDTNYRVTSRCEGWVPKRRARELSEARYREHRAVAARISGGHEEFIVRLLTMPDGIGYGRFCLVVFGEAPSRSLQDRLRQAGSIHDPAKCDGQYRVVVTIDKITPLGPNTFDVIQDMHCGSLCGRSLQWTVHRDSDGTLKVVERVHETIS
jgi:hypothetical protein